MLKCRNNAFYKRLYLDTCLLMFYLFSRPIDILNMKHSNIRKCEKGYYIEYLPIKKKNSANALKSFVRCPISDKAMAIILCFGLGGSVDLFYGSPKIVGSRFVGKLFAGGF